MKNLLTKHFLSFSVALILIIGCNSPTKTKVEKGTSSSGQKAYIEVEDFDANKLKDKIVETISKMPSDKEVVTFLNEAGASYLFDLTVPVGQFEKMLTKSDQSFGLGLYSFDLLYASIYRFKFIIA